MLSTLSCIHRIPSHNEQGSHSHGYVGLIQPCEPTLSKERTEIFPEPVPHGCFTMAVSDLKPMILGLRMPQSPRGVPTLCQPSRPEPESVGRCLLIKSPGHAQRHQNHQSLQASRRCHFPVGCWENGWKVCFSFMELGEYLDLSWGSGPDSKLM